MEKYGVPEIIRIVRLFYGDFQCAVEDQGEIGEWFNIKTGVKQGCNMSGFMFLLVMDWILRRSVGKGENGIRWKFTSKLDDLDFADNIALLCSTKHHIQEKTAKLDGEARRAGLKINLEKTKMLRINAKQHGNIVINGKEIEDVSEFTYLGAKVCREGGGMKDLRNRLSKARSVYTRLKRICNSKKIMRRTKIKLYKPLVLSVLLYGCETWKMNKKDDKLLDVFQQKCLRRILKISWEDHVTNEEVQRRTGVHQLSSEVKRRRWKMSDTC
ncbi:uncharacterized protein LOC125560728 [Nematostella vectensis]|uniref:uncharacterized protein LOC125560728 n=1 Tax=Nematostella vectensis TaxID=45351 RepID=UPI0020771C7A|nr:uncharacterized protein LOC125560728 [Nematostella vectensis]